jgi:hypothetical protein
LQGKAKQRILNGWTEECQQELAEENQSPQELNINTFFKRENNGQII